MHLLIKIMLFIINLIKRNPVISLFVLIGIILTIVLMATTVFKKELVLTKTSPFAGSKIETVYQTDPVVLYFSEPLDEETVRINVFPETKFNFKVDSSGSEGSISINPIPWWNYDTNYTVTVDKSLRSSSGAALKDNVIFSFSLVFPKTQENIPDQPGPPPGYPSL